MDNEATPLAWNSEKLEHYIRTLEKEHRAMREALNGIDNTISGSHQWWKSITSKVLSSLSIK